MEKNLQAKYHHECTCRTSKYLHQDWHRNTDCELLDYTPYTLLKGFQQIHRSQISERKDRNEQRNKKENNKVMSSPMPH